MPIAGWIAARTMRLLLRDRGGLLPHAGDGLPPSIASRAELAPAFRRSRRESGRPTVAAHWSTTLSISTSDSKAPHRLSAESSSTAPGSDRVAQDRNACPFFPSFLGRR